MRAERMAGVRRDERGIALVMVILVLLVLTALGITATMMMTQEDRISSRQDLQKAALYVAEAGLRRGEQIFQGSTVTNAALTLFLSHASSTVCKAAPDAVPVPPPGWDLRHLGTYLADIPNGGAEFSNREFSQAIAGTQLDRKRAYYTLYVRNNPEDPGGPATNLDLKLRLISVGFITDNQGVAADGSANVLAVKILEEEYNFEGLGQGFSAQKEMNAGATSSVVYAGGAT